MTDFAFLAPSSLEEALALLAEYGEDARPYAGGTALILLLNQKLIAPTALVALSRVPSLTDIADLGDAVQVGALVAHRAMEQSPLVRTAAPAVAEAYRAVATPRIRNQATVGGGLAHGDPAQDPPAALLAADASVRIVGLSGERVVPLTAFWRDYYETALQPGEILTHVLIPKQSEHTGAVYCKFLPRTVDDYGTVCVAARVRLDDGVIRDARVAFNAAGATPFRAAPIESMIEGQPPSHDLFHAAADLAQDLVDPMDDVRGSAAYKRKMAVVFTRRALEAAAARASGRP